jgi:hypothetical protein
VKQLLTIHGLSLMLASGLSAAEPSISFTKDVAPILVSKCLACHNAEKAKGGYLLHNFEALMKAGSSDEQPVLPGRSDQSKVYQLISDSNEEDRMPQKDEALPASHIALIKNWIDQGARFDATDRSLPLSALTAPKHPAAPPAYRVAVPVTALAFDPSGERLAAGGYHEITIWNPRNGTIEQRIGNVAEKTFDLAFSSDGRWLAVASGTRSAPFVADAARFLLRTARRIHLACATSCTSSLIGRLKEETPIIVPR